MEEGQEGDGLPEEDLGRVDPDRHLCLRCRRSFADLDDYVQHRRENTCHSRSKVKRKDALEQVPIRQQQDVPSPAPAQDPQDGEESVEEDEETCRSRRPSADQVRDLSSSKIP